MAQKKKPEKISSDQAVLFLTGEAYKLWEQVKRESLSPRDGGLGWTRNVEKIQHVFADALALAEKFPISGKTAEFLVVDYLAKLKKCGTPDELVFDTYLPHESFIIEFAKFGASRETMEALMKELAARNKFQGALGAAKVIGRNLTEDELLLFVARFYANRTRGNDPTEKELLAAAREHLAPAGVERIKKALYNRKVESWNAPV